jgi:hypothetical protein
MRSVTITARVLITCVALVAMIGSAGPVSAATITFEHIPGMENPPDDNSVLIGTQFMSLYNVSFLLANGNLPHLAQVGNPRTAFFGPGPEPGGVTPDSGPDLPAPGQGIGNYFLTDDGSVGLGIGDPIGLIINYATPTYLASGMILDVDLTERWTIRAYSENVTSFTTYYDDIGPPPGLATITGGGTMLGEITLNGPAFMPNGTNIGDGKVTPFGFGGGGNLDTQILHPGVPIQSVIIYYSGLYNESGFGVGFAFDNFSPPSLESFFECVDDPETLEVDESAVCVPPTAFDDLAEPVPEPATIATSLLGIGYVVYRRRRASRP